MDKLNKDIANLLKELRINEGLTQKELSENVLSRTAYSRLEAGETQLSTPELLKLLDKLNLNYSEFFYLLRSEKSIKQKVLDEAEQIFSNIENDTKILDFTQQNLKKYNKNKDMFYFYIAIYGKILLHCASETEINKIFTYLKNKERYIYFDFRLLSNSITLLSPKQIQILTNKMLPQLNTIDPDMKTDSKINSIFINLINLSLANYEKEYTTNYLNSAFTHNKNFPDLFMKINLKFLSKLAEFRFENSIQALEDCFKIIDWFDFMDYPSLAVELKRDLKIYNDYKDIPVPLTEFQVVHTEYT